MDPHEREANPARTRALLALVVAVQLALAVWGAAHKSLVQDELHTRFHASAASLAELFANLGRDNHPPLGFLLVRAGRNLLGDSELALRAPLILCGLLGTVYIARLCRRVEAPVVTGAALWALCSTQLEFSTQARMYGLSALCAAGALDALARLGDEGPVRRRDTLELALWVAAGMLSHYYWLFYAAAMGAALALGALVSARGRRVFLRALPAALATALLCAPWYLSTFREQIASALPPGMSRGGWLDPVESFLHLLVWSVSLGGPGLREAFIASAALGVLLALAGIVVAWRSDRRESALVVGAMAFAVPLLTGLAAARWRRMGFNWNYVLPSLPPLVLAIAWGTSLARPARLAGGLVIALGLALSVLNARAPNSEDHRAAVSHVFEIWRPGDVLYVVELQGQVFEQGMAWDYYAPRFEAQLPPPHPEPRRANRVFDVDEPAQLDGHARVILYAKVAQHMQILARLRERYPRESLETFGYGVEVYVFQP